MLNRAWIEREAPLDHCPLAACRRSGTCRHATDQDPCRRLHETKNQAYDKLATKLDRLREELIAKRPPGSRVKVAAEGTPLFEKRLKRVYDSLRARDQAESARAMAEAAAQREKPATPPKGA